MSALKMNPSLKARMTLRTVPTQTCPMARQSPWQGKRRQSVVTTTKMRRSSRCLTGSFPNSLLNAPSRYAMHWPTLRRRRCAMSAAKILWGQILAVLIIIVASVWSATQWTASALGFQPELGAPLICPLLSGPISILGMATKEEWNGKEAQAGRHYRQAA